MVQRVEERSELVDLPNDAFPNGLFEGTVLFKKTCVWECGASAFKRVSDLQAVLPEHTAACNDFSAMIDRNSAEGRALRLSRPGREISDVQASNHASA